MQLQKWSIIICYVEFYALKRPLQVLSLEMEWVLLKKWLAPSTFFSKNFSLFYE